MRTPPRSTLHLLPIALLALAPLPVHAQAFALARKLVVGGEGGWDYLVVEPSTRRVFLSRSTHVMVVDAVTGKVLGDIQGTNGVHGVALVAGRNRGFTSNGRDSTVTEFDLTSLAALRTIHVPGRNPDAIMYDSASDRVFTFNGGSANATAIDARTGDVVGTVSLSGKPEAAVSDGQGRIFVNIEDRSELTLFDARTLKVISTWPLAPCEEPTGLAIDRATHRLFSSCSNSTLVVVDQNSGRIVSSLPIGRGADGVAFDPALHRAFATAGVGNVTVIREDSENAFVVEASLTSMPGARTVALDPVRHEVYTVTAEVMPAEPPVAGQPAPRARYKPDTFTVLVFSQAGRGR